MKEEKKIDLRLALTRISNNFILYHDSLKAEVEPLIVASRHRRKGIGEALLSHIIEEGRKLGVRYLNVRPGGWISHDITIFHSQAIGCRCCNSYRCFRY